MLWERQVRIYLSGSMPTICCTLCLLHTQIAATLTLDTSTEKLPNGGTLRSAFIEAELAFWQANATTETSITPLT